jgi:hypothetical protein
MPLKDDKKQVSVILDLELHKKLQKYAKEKRWSMSQAGAALIEDALNRVETESKKDD